MDWLPATLLLSTVIGFVFAVILWIYMCKILFCRPDQQVELDDSYSGPPQLGIVMVEMGRATPAAPPRVSSAAEEAHRGGEGEPV